MGDDELDLLSEITTHPGWRTLKKELDNYLKGYYNKLLTPAVSDFDLVKKEAWTEVIRSHKQFLAQIEERVEKVNRSIRRGT